MPSARLIVLQVNLLNIYKKTAIFKEKQGTKNGKWELKAPTFPIYKIYCIKMIHFVKNCPILCQIDTLKPVLMFLLNK